MQLSVEYSYNKVDQVPGEGAGKLPHRAYDSLRVLLRAGPGAPDQAGAAELRRTAKSHGVAQGSSLGLEIDVSILGTA